MGMHIYISFYVLEIINNLPINVDFTGFIKFKRKIASCFKKLYQTIINQPACKISNLSHLKYCHTNDCVKHSNSFKIYTWITYPFKIISKWHIS